MEVLSAIENQTIQDLFLTLCNVFCLPQVNICAIKLFNLIVFFNYCVVSKGKSWVSGWGVNGFKCQTKHLFGQPIVNIPTVNFLCGHTIVNIPTQKPCFGTL